MPRDCCHNTTVQHTPKPPTHSHPHTLNSAHKWWWKDDSDAILETFCSLSIIWMYNGSEYIVTVGACSDQCSAVGNFALINQIYLSKWHPLVNIMQHLTAKEPDVDTKNSEKESKYYCSTPARYVDRQMFNKARYWNDNMLVRLLSAPNWFIHIDVLLAAALGLTVVVSPPLWSRLKYFNSYWMDFHDTFFTPVDNCIDVGSFCTTINFSSSSTLVTV